ncbi:hypothetical protein [bacterium endosymbiont of Bathymodiolus sp. 5 South]|jgi:hypothetical protein|uniref:hypothetical protein n=1 Tax=bacterium endosymbiont of Bathymodiolus sp. 5 South TaxID=1181670 RepID=UPI0010AF619A|nr:hypothetical protein [bacterium endosymbiont of Bathymodiolus sp. 5 South]CAC9436377.1 hypothetical protein [uncultured Gammaproteobacteria bacterium]SSC07820.1 hypothetical protein BTURTLESOX_2456 [bacterium endosymbiont of Bathymodiolus sp. 5 South]VVH62815.1 hypothetical protein BSPWISOX_552 [uncultured Gammaproteobacteria bacterium]VVM21064.1 hypothetical protein BSPWISOXPB_8115 [uncultured Gammaproteobacteria bacterium]VVM23072.1 hypothetical protein BSPWISOXPB_8096 [uncultured Gammapr
MLKTTLTTIFLIVTISQVQAQMTLKHGFYLSQSAGNIDADMSGQHKDLATYQGKDANPSAGGSLYAGLPSASTTIYDGEISNARSFGYNLRYTPKVGFGYELGLYLTKLKMPTQDVALIHDDGSAFKKITGADVVVDSPSSHIKTTDLYLGGLYNFEAVGGITPYVGLGYAKVKGNWYKSYWRGYPGLGDSDEVSGYGQRGKTKVNGHYISAKVGINFNENYNLELEHAKHKIHADSFRSFDINGLDAKFNRTSVNLIVNF